MDNHSAGARAMATREHRHILIIEDHPLEHDLDAALKAEFFDVFTASEAATAIGVARTTVLDVALLSMRLFDASAMSVLQAMTSHVPSLPVIVLGTPGDPRAIVQAMQLGAFDVLPGLVTPADVVASVRRSIAAHVSDGRLADRPRGLAAVRSREVNPPPRESTRPKHRRRTM